MRPVFTGTVKLINAREVSANHILAVFVIYLFFFMFSEQYVKPLL